LDGDQVIKITRPLQYGYLGSFMKIYQPIVGMCFVALLTACGGGGGGGTTAPAAAAVASTQTFQIQTAIVNLFTSTSTLPFSVSGTVNGATVTGTGTVTNGSVSGATFRAITGFQKSSTVSMNLTANGTTVPVTSTSISYVDTNYVPLGSSGSEYEVVTGAVTIPTTALVNDTGTAYTANRYTSSSMNALLGTDTVTYVVLPDTATTAFLKVTHTLKNTGGTMTSQSTVTLKIAPAGAITRISETGIDVVNNTNLLITY
jgi:hypothetical protein